MKQTKKRRTGLLAAAMFWLAVWQAAAMAIGQEVFLGQLAKMNLPPSFR